MQTYNLRNCNKDKAIKKALFDYFGGADKVEPLSNDKEVYLIWFKDIRPQKHVYILRNNHDASLEINSKEGVFYVYF